MDTAVIHSQCCGGGKMRIAQHLIVIEADTKGQDSAGSGHDWHGQAGLHGKVIDVPGTSTTDREEMIVLRL